MTPTVGLSPRSLKDVAMAMLLHHTRNARPRWVRWCIQIVELLSVGHAMHPFQDTRRAKSTSGDGWRYGALLSEVLKRGWRAEFLCQRFRPLFCTPFPISPVGEEEHNSGEPFCCFQGPFGRHLPPANPFSEPLLVSMPLDTTLVLCDVLVTCLPECREA